MRKRRATIIGVFSAKGGVGKTTTAVNLGAALAQKIENKVLVTETNMLASSLGLYFGILDPSPALQDVVLGEAEIEDAIQVPEEGLHVLPGSVDFSGKIGEIDLESLLEPIRNKYRVIIIDPTPTLGLETYTALRTCDEAFLICRPEMPSVTGTLQVFKAAKREKTPITGVIVNNVTNKDYEISLSDIRKTFGRTPTSIIPNDEAVPESIAQGVPLVINNPESAAAEEFKRLADVTLARIKSQGKVK